MLDDLPPFMTVEQAASVLQLGRSKTYELTEGIHNYLMEKSYEAQIAVNSDQVDKTVVDAARPETPAPIAPDKKVVLGGAFAVGLIVLLASIVSVRRVVVLEPAVVFRG